ncbi:hypothetical protein TWF694_007778 [Orbilia ellipsospora]|uniref:Uncharacterized protein n=1 Tax=Orbilia ellipsospora TaxID=2528407 RepID=A0AAV9XK72_9PEZI
MMSRKDTSGLALNWPLSSYSTSPPQQTHTRRLSPSPSYRHEQSSRVAYGPIHMTTINSLPPPYTHLDIAYKENRSILHKIRTTIRRLKPTPTAHKLVLTFLIANTVLFALLVYNLESAAAVAARGEELCRCPLNNGDTRTCVKVFEMIEGAVGVYGPPSTATDASKGGDIMAAKGWIGDYEGFEKLRMWEMCHKEVRAVVEWREWVLWVLMPLQCLVEIVVAWGWWLCLVEQEKMEEEQEERRRREELERYEEKTQLDVV